MKKRSLLGIALLLTCASAFAADFKGKVVGVIDGDTLDVLTGQMQKIRVRLVNIDAPEKAQPYGTRSKQTLSDLVYGKQVLVRDHGQDMYGRQLGEVMFGRSNTNKAMVYLGMAWAYRPKLSDKSLLSVEKDARNARRGLWAGIDPTAPWEFRKAKRKGTNTHVAAASN